MIDYLSYLTHYSITEYQSSAVILISVYLKDDVLEILRSIKFEKAYFYLDNDDAGKKCYQQLSEGLSYPHVNQSTTYQEYKGFNEFHVASKLKITT